MLVRNWTRFALLVAVAWGGCRKAEVARPSPPDAYRSPYLPIDPGTRTGDAGLAVDFGEEARPRPRVHPASRERAYPLEEADRLAQDDFERELLGLMKDPKQGPDVLERVARAGARGLRAMRKALRCQDRTVRVQACLVLGNLTGRSAGSARAGREEVAALSDAVLLDPDPDVRATAAKAFVALKSREAVPALIRSVSEDPYAPARANAAWALGQVGGRGVVDALRRALKDEDTWVRLRAVTALGRLRAREAIPDLRAMREDPNSMVRERVREVLRALGQP